MKPIIPSEYELEEGTPPDPEEGVVEWTEGQRKKAKLTLYGVADSLDQAGASVDEVCRFLALFGQQIGDPERSYRNWEDRAYLYAEKISKKFKSDLDTSRK